MKKQFVCITTNVKDINFTQQVVEALEKNIHVATVEHESEEVIVFTTVEEYEVALQQGKPYALEQTPFNLQLVYPTRAMVDLYADLMFTTQDAFYNHQGETYQHMEYISAFN